MPHMDTTVTRRTLLHGSAAATLAGILGTRAFATANAQGQATPTAGGTVTISYPQATSFSHFCHLRYYAGSENVYMRALIEGRLITIDHERTSFVGDLAERYEFSEDGSTITFFLRPGLTWHDGTPLTSADVDFTYHMIGIPGVGPNLLGAIFNTTVVGMKEWIDGAADRISGLTVIDDLTVSFSLLPELAELGVLTLFNQVCLAPQHMLSDYLNRDSGAAILQSEWATTASHIGAGPFRVIEYVPDQYVRYAPFDNYYGGKPLLEEVVFRSFADGTTNAAALQSKEVDVARIPAAEYERFKELDFLSFVEQRSPMYGGTPFNARQPYLNKDVRQALLHAIDREAMVKTLYVGAVEVVHSQIWVPQTGDSPNLKKYEYDPEKAKALLQSGGWDPSRKIRWAVGQLPSSEDALAYYAAINGYWEAVGVQAEFQVFGQDSSILWGPNWDFDLYPSSYPIGLPQTVAVHYDPRAIVYVSSGYDTPEFRELWAQSFRRASDDEYQAAVWALQETLAEEALGLMIARNVDIWGLNLHVQNLTPAAISYGSDIFNWEWERVWSKA
jgi:peptide/nickel transport system substrate-binding protein